MNTLKRTARIAGWQYLFFAMVSIVVYLSPGSVVPGDAAATANRIGSSELLFRAEILGSLITLVIFVFLVLTLYRLFKEVDPGQALLMVIFVAIGVALSLANLFNRIAALTILGGADVLSVFEKPQLDALAYVFLRFHGQATQVIQVFWGLWLFPFGLLVYKSRFIPKILGVLLIVAGFAYVLSSVAFLVLPPYKAAISPLITLLEMGELPIIFWLVIVGVKEQSQTSPTPAALSPI